MRGLFSFVNTRGFIKHRRDSFYRCGLFDDIISKVYTYGIDIKYNTKMPGCIVQSAPWMEFEDDIKFTEDGIPYPACLESILAKYLSMFEYEASRPFYVQLSIYDDSGNLIPYVEGEQL